jgi:hypothetical protein
MNLSNYEQANYQHLQDRLEQWQRYDFEKQLNNKLYNVLKRVNWHKNIFVKKHTTLKIGSLISVLNGFEYCQKELKHIKTQMRLMNISTLRTNYILLRTEHLINLTYKKIQQ